MRSETPTRVRLGLTLALALGSCVLPNVIYSVLANDLLDTLRLSRTGIGLLMATFGASAAVMSPVVGRLADAFGGKRVLILGCVFATVGTLAISQSRTMVALLAGTAVAAVGNAAGNPATNAVIARATERGDRGLVVGIKQSGIQLAYFVGGAVLPVVAATLGWTYAVLAVAFVPLGTIIVLSMSITSDTGYPGYSRKGNRAPISRSVRRIAQYAFLMGVATSATTGFLPLYAHESVGLTKIASGWTVGLVGGVGVAARVWLSVGSERYSRYARTLLALAATALVSIALIGSASRTGAGPLFLGSVLAGASLVAWNAVAMLAVIEGEAQGSVGRASGVVLLGFLAGLSVGPVAMGALVDSTGSYALPWTVVGSVITCAAFSLLPELRRGPPQVSASSCPGGAGSA